MAIQARMPRFGKLSGLLEKHTDLSFGDARAKLDFDGRRIVMARTLSNSCRQYTTSDLIEQAIEHERQDDGSRNEALVELQARGSRDVLEAAERLCHSQDSLHRLVGARILGELGNDRSFPEECCDILLELCHSERVLEVLRCALFSLGHLGNPRCQPDLIRFADHPDPIVRYAVAFSFHEPQTEEAVQVLLRLMTDNEDVRIRDWATTALGQSGADSKGIRAALLVNAMDEDELVRGEALQGLARRKDRQGIDVLMKALSAPSDCPSYFTDAAKIYLSLDLEREFDPLELIVLLQSSRQ
ncbi:HEAT repeat domain-containing protein [Labrys neptuniae]